MLLSDADGTAPTNYVGVGRMKYDFGDKVIPLMAHFTVYASDGETVIVDPMQCESYFDVADEFGFQLNDAVFDRYQIGDAYMGFTYPVEEDEDGLHALYGATESINILDSINPAVGKLTLDAYYANISRNSIGVDVEYEFGINRLTSDYALAFVLTEDGVTGEDSTWLQTNYFSQMYADIYEELYGEPFTLLDAYKNEDTQAWVDASPLVKMIYDDVVVYIWNGTTGIEGSVASRINAGKPGFYNTTLDISSIENIQDKEALKLTAILINRSNGTIVNADQVALGIGPDTPSGIEDVQQSSTNITEVARYSVNGSRIDAPTKGINIIKYSDGSVKKVVVK